MFWSCHFLLNNFVLFEPLVTFYCQLKIDFLSLFKNSKRTYCGSYSVRWCFSPLRSFRENSLNVQKDIQSIGMYMRAFATCAGSSLKVKPTRLTRLKLKKQTEVTLQKARGHFSIFLDS